MIDLEKLSKSHKELFPNATAESQVWKLEEEIKEYKEAQGFDECLKEISDVLIVCCGLYRWCPFLAKTIYNVILNGCIYEWDDRLEAEVKRKWQINLNRKWVWNGKTYHHEGNDD